MRIFVVLLALISSTLALAADDGWSWATAVSKHHSNGRAIVFRYVRTFPPGFDKAAQFVRVIIVWKYRSDTGMPNASERQRMDRLEELLKLKIEEPGVATLAIVSTGENLREWTYYTKTEALFFEKLNAGLAGEPRFPIEIHVASDRIWNTYESFRAGVKE